MFSFFCIMCLLDFVFSCIYTLFLVGQILKIIYLYNQLDGRWNNLVQLMKKYNYGKKIQTIRSSVLSSNMCVNIGHSLLFPFLDCRFLTGRFQICLFLRLIRPRSWCLAYILDAMLVSMVKMFLLSCCQCKQIYIYIYMYRPLYLSGLSYVVLYIVFV